MLPNGEFLREVVKMPFRFFGHCFIFAMLSSSATAAFAQRIVNGIAIPPGASEAFASFPADVRAILQPEAPLTLEQARRPCVDPDTLGLSQDPIISLETGKFALRAADFSRGHCWVSRAAADKNYRAFVILGVLNLMGWDVPKNLELAYRYFNGEAGREREPWAIYFMKQCFENGWGTAQNKQSAINMESWLISHEQGQNVYLAIGADDVQKVKDYNKGYNRAVILLNPPVKSHEVCNYNLPHQAPCHTVTEVDQDSLKRQLNGSN